MPRRIMGIDEAGRGPVIGPMVVCGVVAKEDAIEHLIELGVKDSKALKPSRRKELRNLIIDGVEAWEIQEVPPREVDEAVRKGRLNFLEAKKMAVLISRFKPDVTYVDAPSINTTAFLRCLKGFLKGKDKRMEIVAENFADERYPIVGAASILAKLRRDEVLESYKALYGDFGSGYPSDDATIRFLESYYRTYGKFPEIARLEWETNRNILERILQKKT
ncbi:ribonuclease HII [Candidatus Bathyarchaeota archaeon]|nr:ribonuclease HII [Candidatus Bathyarchaeota archaeon]